MSVKRLLVAPAPRVLLPGGRLDLRLDRAEWSNSLRAARVPGLAVLFRPRRGDAWPGVGTFAGIVGRRGAGEVIHVRLRGLRRLVPLEPPVAAAEIPVDVDDGDGAPPAHTAIRNLETLVRRYHGLLAEHGEKADISFELPEDSEAALYAVASLLRVSGPEQQFVLDADSPQERAKRITAILEREIRLLRGSMGRKGP